METLDVVKCCAPFFPRGAASDSSTFPSLCWTTQAVYNYVTGQKELRFSVQMWNDEAEKQTTNYVGVLLGKHVVQKQIEMVPFDKVMLASSTKAWQCK